MVSSLPSHLLGRISPIFSPFFLVFCAFSPSRRGGSNEPQAGTQGQETAGKPPRGVFDSGPQRLCDESPAGKGAVCVSDSQPPMMRPFECTYLSIKNWSAATTLSSAVFGRYGTGPRSFGADFWNPGAKTEKTAKKRRKTEQKWARYGLRRVKEGS